MDFIHGGVLKSVGRIFFTLGFLAQAASAQFKPGPAYRQLQECAASASTSFDAPSNVAPIALSRIRSARRSPQEVPPAGISSWPVVGEKLSAGLGYLVAGVLFLGIAGALLGAAIGCLPFWGAGSALIGAKVGAMIAEAYVAYDVFRKKEKA